MIARARVVLCVVNAVGIITVIYLGLIGVISPPLNNKMIFDNPRTNVWTHHQGLVNSNPDPWDLKRTSTIAKCRDKITGVPELSLPQFLPHLKNPCWFDNSGSFFCLPYYYLIGMLKCGTTDLYSQIKKHPDTAYGDEHIKGDQFWFIHRFAKLNGTLSLQSMQLYVQRFSECAKEVLESAQDGFNNKIIGDGTAGTLYNNKFWHKFRENCNLTEPRYTTADYIHHLVPKAKIIAIFRNPTERAYSSYLFFPNPIKTPDDFHKNVLSAIEWFESCVNTSTTRSCAYNLLGIYRVSPVRIIIGLYYIFIEDYMKVFSKQQVLVVRYEDYIQDRLSTVKSIYKFLELRPLTGAEEKHFLEDDRIANSNSDLKKQVGPMRTDTRKLLDDFYRQYNQRLADLLGDSRFNWR